MTEIGVIGIDLAKGVFPLHGVAADGTTLFRRRLSRGPLERLMAEQPPCAVAMGAGWHARARITGRDAWRRSATRSG